jgi:hypothetical protein
LSFEDGTIFSESLKQLIIDRTGSDGRAAASLRTAEELIH